MIDNVKITMVAARFLDHFGLERTAAPTPERLNSLYRAFGHLPYENVSKIISAAGHGGTYLAAPEEVLEGFLASRLGGTCFSLTHCLYELLRSCGFPAWRVLGDMHHGRNIHCAVVAQAGGQEFLCDAGYLLPAPLALPSDKPVSLRGEVYTYTLSRDREDLSAFNLYTAPPEGGAPRRRYLIRNVPAGDSEFEFHWRRTFDAAMMHQLVLTRAVEGGQIYLHNHKLRFTGPQGKKNSNLRGAVGSGVEELFGIDRARVEEALARITEAKSN